MVKNKRCGNGKNNRIKVIIGVDEAGRGPLAGPIAVGVFALILPAGSSESSIYQKKFKGVKDSKQLSEKQREEWFSRINDMTSEGLVSYDVSFSGSEKIDHDGLTKTVKDMIKRSLLRLEKKLEMTLEDADIRLDGLLKAPERYGRQRTIINGDATVKVIALASICAKVLRDRRMKKLGKMYPQYGFEIHKGYGTRAHYEAIRSFGLTPIHRRRFVDLSSL